MKIVVVKDVKTPCYLQPYAVKSVQDALRSWDVLVNEGDSTISRFPNDFRLLHIADFDTEHGELHILERPQDLGSAADFQRPAPQSPLPFPKPAAQS